MATSARRRWLTRSVLAIGLASLFSDISHEMATTVLPAFLALEIRATPLALGAIEGVADGLASFFKLIGGWWTDRMGRRKPVAISGYAVTTLATASFALATSWPMILLGRALAWMARGWRTPARNALLADTVPQEAYGNAFGFERAMDTVGALVAPVLALSLLTAGASYRHIFALALIPGTLATLAIALFVSEARRPPQPSRTLFTDVRHLPRAFILFLLVAGVFGLGQFAPTLLVLRATELTKSPETAIALYTLFNGVQAASAYAFGALAHRVGSLNLLGASYCGFALVAVGFAYADANMPLLILLFALAGLAVGGIEAMEPTVSAELLPPTVRGTGFGALGAANGLGDLLSSLSVGALWNAYGPGAGFGFAALMNGASVVLLLLWRSRIVPPTREPLTFPH
ncbi:MAG: MFS transporter [Blastocatellia bacterium]|nr:MFS transporter [Blastocatellia bacterium]MDW8168978.1 MFS transporter [Acidobacteriota bacterium]MDW8256738.1 MFS transporter [Acidobacteriota bacterium]